MIFVTGVGRSGTSAVARVIHENKIACMGHKFDEANKDNPLGYWEDLLIRHKLLPNLLAGIATSFEEDVKLIHNNCSKIGFKHPLLCEVGREQWLALQPEAIYLCSRRANQIMPSMAKFRGGHVRKSSPKSMQAFYDMRMECIADNIEGLPCVVKLDMSIHRTDQWILEQINDRPICGAERNS